MPKRKYILEHDQDGWWAYYTAGWKSGSDPVGVQHSDQADTKAEILQAVRDAIKCECGECQKTEAQNAKR